MRMHIKNNKKGETNMKRLISLLLVAMMALSLCMVSAGADEPIEIEIAVSSLGNGWPTDLADDFVYQKILEDTGISMKLVLVDDYYTAINARMAGGNTPDMIRTDVDHMITWARMETIKDLTPYLDNELANYKAWLGSTEMAACYVDGKLFALPQLYDGSKHQYCVTVRQDWLDALGLQMPTTLQEYYDVAYAFTYNDPDQNGLDDTIGITAAKGMVAFNSIMGCFDTVLSNQIIIRDGKVTNTLLQPGMVEGLQWCKKFVDDKLIDPDCVTTTGTDKFKAGTVGMHACSWPGIWKTYGQEQIHAINPNAVTSFFTTLKSEVGAEDVMFTDDLNTTNNVLAVSADISDEKLEAMFKLIDYLVSDEGSKLVFYGLENVHWKYDENGNIVMTENATAANYISTYQLFSRKEAEYLGVKFPEAKEVFEATMSAGRIQVYNSLVREPEEMYLSDMEAYVKQEMLNFIYGDRELSQEEYDKFIQELRDLYDFDAYMEAATEQLTAYGFVE